MGRSQSTSPLTTSEDAAITLSGLPTIRRACVMDRKDGQLQYRDNEDSWQHSGPEL